MDERDEDARRWAPPGHPAAGESRGERARSQPGQAQQGQAQPEQQPYSAAAPWTRGLGPTRKPWDASATPPSEIEAPELPWVAPPETEMAEAREKSMLPIAIGVALLAVLACVPHWVAPTIALMVSLVGVPIAWGFRRISHGRRRLQYIVVVLTLLLIAALSVIAPLTWLQLGVLQPLTVPD